MNPWAQLYCTSHVYAVPDESAVGTVRRGVAAKAQREGWDETAVGRISVVVTEAASNLARHAKDGKLLAALFHDGDGLGIDLLSIDHGPGMRDVARCLEDGVSRGSTPGTGLGAMRRLSQRFSIHSAPGRGTVVWARLREKGPQAEHPWSAAALLVPYPGETVCGDRASGWIDDNKASFLLADGLGHGPLAAEAAEEAVRTHQALGGASPSEVLDCAHKALRGSRGAAVAVARIDRALKKLTFAGVGNVSAWILSEGRAQGLVSHNGTVGLGTRAHEYSYDWPSGATLVMHSDGLLSRWVLPEGPNLLCRPPLVIAAALYRDFARNRDDASVLVYQNSSEVL